MIGVLTGAAILLGLLGAAFFCGCETGLYCVNRLRVQLGAQKGDPSHLRLSALLEDEQGALSVTLLGTNLMEYVATTAVAFLFAELLFMSESDTELYTVLLMTPLVFVFCEVVPKNLYQLYADLLMPKGSRLLIIADRVFRATGVVWLLMVLTGAAGRLFGVPMSSLGVTAPKRRMTALIREALVGQEYGEHQSQLVDRVIRLSETPVRAVMVHQHRVVTVAAAADHRELDRIARRSAFARCPVHGKRKTEIVGVIKVDELLRADDWKTVGERIGPITRLRPHQTLASAIVQLKQSGELGVVTDHAGQMIGVVTLRDLLEEVVGGFGRGN